MSKLIKIVNYCSSVNYDLDFMTARIQEVEYAENDYTFSLHQKFYYPNPAGPLYHHETYSVGGVQFENLRTFLQSAVKVDLGSKLEACLREKVEEPGREVHYELLLTEGSTW